jgi:uncharacterized protein YdaU (DUF1376 family)
MTRQPVDPWFKFFPRDWLDRTRELTLEQRGAYIDMIAMRMLSEGPLQDDYSWLGHQMHISKRKTEVIVTELVKAMKIVRTERGLTNERCEEELRAREHQRKVNTDTAVKRERDRRENSATQDRTDDENLANGSRENNEKAENGNDINQGAEISCPESSTTRARLDTDTELEGEEEKKDIPTEGVGMDAEKQDPKPKTVRSYSAEFEAFWEVFPVKDGKWAAFDKSWRKLSAEDRHDATRGAVLYAERVKRERIEKPKWPQGWLTDRRWEDELLRAEPAAESAARRPWWQDPAKLGSLSEADWDHLIDKHANGIWPIDKLGWPPADPRHVVPESVIARRRLLDLYDQNGIARGGKAHA